MDNKSHKLWPLIGYTQFNDYEIIDYDYLYFNNYQGLVERFEQLKDSKKNIIIDKTLEQLTDGYDPLQSQLDELNHFLETYNCKTRSVVFDNTHNDYFFNIRKIKHLAAPFHIYTFINPISGVQIPKWYNKVSFTFLCLNNRPRRHRKKFLEALSQNNILPKTKWSFRYETDSNIISTPKFIDQIDQIDGNFDKLANLENLYQDCLVGLVTEGEFYATNMASVTEKSLFAIFYGCLPLIVGVPGCVDLLRSWGIDMYDDIIDHSYDNVTDHDQRLQMIVDQCKQLASERYPEKIKNLMAARILRNQLLLSNKIYWENQIRRIMCDFNFDKY